MKKRTKSGSIVIEAAVGFSVVLIILTIMITYMNIYKTDIAMQAAIEQSTEDLSAFLPFVRFGAEGVNLVTGSEETGSAAAEAYDEIAMLSERITGIAGMSIEELLTDHVLGAVIKNDVAANYIERCGDTNLYVPDSIYVEVCYDPDKNAIEELITYNIPTLFGDIQRTDYAAIPFYGSYNAALRTGVETASEGVDDPWALNNLERGKYFEDAYGSNLPHLFPVINSFEDGNCTSTVSIDLTRDMYKSSGNIEKTMEREIGALDAFNGADVNIHGQRYKVDAGDIRSKTLNVVIPENTPEDRLHILFGAIEKHGAAGVQVNVYTQGVSN